MDVQHTIVDRAGEIRLAKVTVDGQAKYSIESLIQARGILNYRLHASYPTLGEARKYFQARTGKTATKKG